MTGLDTNVLVRLLTGDDAEQRLAAKVFISRNRSAEDPAFISRVVLVDDLGSGVRVRLLA